MSDNRPGVMTALNQLEGAGDLAPSDVSGDPRELELFDTQDDRDGPLSKTLRERRGPGRPPGSPNKRTADLRRFILARYKHPVIAAAEIFSMSVDELAAALNCDKRDAVLVQVRCAEFVAPYIEAKMPQRVAITDDRSLPSYGLTFGKDGATLTDEQGRKVDLIALAARAKDAMDQRLINGEAIKSHGDGSQDEGQDADDKDKMPF